MLIDQLCLMPASLPPICFTNTTSFPHPVAELWVASFPSQACRNAFKRRRGWIFVSFSS